jgi:hypothetical protein
MGRRRPIVGIAYIQTGKAFLLQAIFTIWPDLVVPIQTGASQRNSGPRVALPAHRLY